MAESVINLEEVFLRNPDVVTDAPPVSEALPVSIEFRSHWGEPWKDLTAIINEAGQDATDFRLDWIEWTTAPQVPRAQLSYRYGRRFNTTSAAIPVQLFTDLLPSDVTRFYVRIRLTDRGDFGPHFIGVVDIEGRVFQGTLPSTLPGGTASGQQIYIAYGIEHLMRQSPILHDYWARRIVPVFTDQATEFIGIKRAERGLTFNSEGRPNRSPQRYAITGTNRPNDPLLLPDPQGSEGHYFFDTQNANLYPSPEFWSTRDIVEYLLRFHTPKSNYVDDSSAELTRPTDIKLTILDDELDKLPTWDQPVVETHGRTLFDVLNQLISRQRFYTWYLAYSPSEDTNLGVEADTVYVRIATFAPADVNLFDDRVLRANRAQFILNVEQDASANVEFKEDHTNIVDQVVVQGARVRDCFSVVYGAEASVGKSRSEFIERWTLEEETDYDLGADSDNPAWDALSSTDRDLRRKLIAAHRARPELFNVYRKLGLYVENSTFPAWYSGVDDDLADLDYVVYANDIRILPSLPLIQGADYSSNNIRTDQVTYSTNEPRNETNRPLWFFKVPRELTGSYLDTYVAAEDIGHTSKEIPISNKEKLSWSCHVQVLADDPSFYVHVTGQAPQHVIGYSHFAPMDEERRPETLGEVDYQECIGTIAIDDDRHCEARWPTALPEIQREVRRFYIDAGDSYRVDMVSPNTVVGLTSDGDLITSEGGLIRDDRDQLKTIAVLAHQFYSLPRRTIRVTADYREVAGNFLFRDRIPLGALVTEVRQNLIFGAYLSTLPVNTVITSIRVDFPRSESDQPPVTVGRPVMQFETDFAAFDPLRFVASVPLRARVNSRRTRSMTPRR